MKDFILIKDKNTCIPIQDNAELYLDDNMSTNVIYPQNIYIISSKEYLDIIIDDNDIMNIMDLSVLDDITDISNINDIEYVDISQDGLLVSNITSKGISINEYYFHNVYLSLTSGDECDYVFNLNIDNNNVLVNCSFYSQVEELSVNLQNIGVKLNPDISRAIYESNVRDEKIDYIILNKKYKELLLCGLDIIERKGSHKSMIDSFNWFGYRDIANLREYWSNTSNRLYYQDVSKLYTDSFNSIISNNYKTTYISIYSLLNKVTGYYKSDTITELNSDNEGILSEPIPEIEDISFDITTQDLKLKLILLGNYYSTFFLPIHIDLLSSTTERYVFPNQLIKHHNIATSARQDSVNNLLSFNCEVSEKYYMDDVYVVSDTITQCSSGDGFIDNNILIGCETVADLTDNIINDDKVNNTLYNGFGSIVNIPIYSDYKISSMIIKIEYNGEVFLTKRPIYPYYDQLDFNILFRKSGKYTIHIQPISLGSGTFDSNTYDIEILPPKDISINIHNMSLKPIYRDINNRNINEDGLYEYDSDFITSNLNNSIEFTSEDGVGGKLFNSKYGVVSKLTDLKVDSLSHNVLNISIDSQYNVPLTDADPTIPVGGVVDIVSSISNIKDSSNWTYNISNINFYYSLDGEYYTRITNKYFTDSYISSKDIIDTINSGYVSGTSDIQLSYINRLSGYTWWIFHSFTYIGESDVVSGDYYVDGVLKGYIEDGKIYTHSPKLIGLRLITSDIISETYPLVKVGYDSIQIINSADIYYRDVLIPLMWRVGGDVSIIQPESIFCILTQFENIQINYIQLINNSTGKTFTISNQHNLLISYSNETLYKVLERGIYSINISYNIPDITGDVYFNREYKNFFILN